MDAYTLPPIRGTSKAATKVTYSRDSSPSGEVILAAKASDKSVYKACGPPCTPPPLSRSPKSPRRQMIGINYSNRSDYFREREVGSPAPRRQEIEDAENISTTARDQCPRIMIDKCSTGGSGYYVNPSLDLASSGKSIQRFRSVNSLSVPLFSPLLQRRVSNQITDLPLHSYSLTVSDRGVRHSRSCDNLYIDYQKDKNIESLDVTDDLWSLRVSDDEYVGGKVTAGGTGNGKVRVGHGKVDCLYSASHKTGLASRSSKRPSSQAQQPFPQCP